ncbi:hypothetical protein [Eisenbergiella sp.]
MTEWKIQRGTQYERPEEIDRTSSPTTVYLRRNIKQVTTETEGESGEMQSVSGWEYEEQEMTPYEYENMLMMQQVVMENTQDIVTSVTGFQKEQAIDEYTLQLVEEGLL